MVNKLNERATTMFKHKNNNVEAEAPKKVAKKKRFKSSGIIGLLMLLVVTSIAYSTYVVWFGTTGLAPKIMLAPQMLFAAVVMISKFNK